MNTTEKYLQSRGIEYTILDSGMIKVSGYLYLEGTSDIELPQLQSVGGYLDLRGTSAIELPQLQSVGGSLYLEGTSDIASNRLGFVDKSRTYLVFDRIATYIDSTKQVGGFTVHKAEYICNDKKADKCVYIAIKGEYSAHGKTAREAISDCNFKHLQATVDITELVEQIKQSNSVTVESYRLLTGACSEGCRVFLEGNGIAATSVTIKECLDLTKGHWGHDRIAHLFQ